MRRIGWVGNGSAPGSPACCGQLLGAILLLLINAAACLAADQPGVFPEVPYDGYIIYESLAVFWIALIGLIVIIRMKLREVERTQALGADREDPDAPLLQ